MRVAIYVAAVLALAAAEPALLRNLLASAAGVVLECLPYVCAGLLAQKLLPVATELLAYAGCGCSVRGGARSIPAAVATAWLFGPFVATMRVVAGTAAARVTRRHGQPAHVHSLAGHLVELVPSSIAAAVITTLLPSLHTSMWPAPLQFVGGGLVGIAGSPCALGTVALAAALRAGGGAWAACGILCTAGIISLRTNDRRCVTGDRWTYGVLALTCALVMLGRGAQLINPSIAPFLAICVAASSVAARNASVSIDWRAFVPTSTLLVAVVLAAPPPRYHATETTLADAYAGEPLDFSGIVLNDGHRSMLQRYAITCCRADAEPVTIVLSRKYAVRDGTWVHANGTIVATNSGLVLNAANIVRIPPPNDPFVYR